jgi:putative flippase GtrA
MSQLSRFLIVGVANTGLGYAVIFACMYLAGLNPELSNAAGYAVGLISSYFLNRHFTFRSTQPRSVEFVRFVMVFLASYTANLAVLIVLVRALAVHASLSQVIAGIVYIGTAYILNKHYAFSASNTN